MSYIASNFFNTVLTNALAHNGTVLVYAVLAGFDVSHTGNIKLTIWPAAYASPDDAVKASQAVEILDGTWTSAGLITLATRGLENTSAVLGSPPTDLPTIAQLLPNAMF